ncbi:MAG: hypothetical protein ACXWUE_28270 [Polyangiales bacterium]
MLYSSETRTLIEVVTRSVTEDRLRELAALKGRNTDDGEPIELVCVSFLRMEEGEAALPQCKRLGIACKAFGDDGVERELYAGQRTRSAEGRAEGTLLPLLREEKWPHLDTAIHRRLLSGPGGATQGPWVTYGIDMGETVARYGPQHLGDKTIDDVEKRALENLASRDLKIEELAPGSFAIRDEYAAEAILLPALMRTLQARIGVKLMLVNIPTERMLVATTGEDIDRVKGMIELARKHFDQAQGRRISPLPLLVQDGAVIGFVTGRTEEEPVKEKAWWKFW